MIEILLKFANLQPNDLVEIMDKFVESITNGNGDKDYD
jgi:hypothetical protein